MAIGRDLSVSTPLTRNVASHLDAEIGTPSKEGITSITSITEIGSIA